MAVLTKAVQISINGGTTWLNLPGNTGDLSVEVSSSDYAVFGSEFNASETGIKSWTLSTNAYYPGYAAYKVSIKKIVHSTGTPAVQSGSVSGSTWTTSGSSPWSTEGLIIDPTNAVNVVSVDLMNGIIVFDADPGTVTVTAAPLALASYGFANDWSISQSADTIDTTSITSANTAAPDGSTGWRTFRQGLKSASIELSGFYASGTHDTNLEHLKAGDIVYVEIIPTGAATESYARGMFKIMSDGLSGDIGGDENESISLSLYVPRLAATYDGTAGTELSVKPFAWVHPATTTLSDGVVALLNAWNSETVIDARYLPSGDATEGHSGNVIVTDLSVSGGLESLPEFSVSLQGSGALATLS